MCHNHKIAFAIFAVAGISFGQLVNICMTFNLPSSLHGHPPFPLRPIYTLPVKGFDANSLMPV